MEKVLLKVENLKTYFFTPEGIGKALDGVSLDIPESGSLGLVGESGCGKSTVALSILRLIPSPPGKIVAGKVIFQGKDLLKLPEEEMRQIRGNKISMIFQEPMTSLNPVFTCGDQIAESIVLHQAKKWGEARREAIELLRKVGIPSPEQRLREYPHQLSGGMRQRVMIAMALACQPQLLIADEPTTALDVTIQAQILELLKHLEKEYQMALLLITHDLGIIAEMVQEVAVMYAGLIIERAPCQELFSNPAHPYTQGLLASLPTLQAKDKKIQPIPGRVPSATAKLEGCRFHPRCSRKEKDCAHQVPSFQEITPGHWVRCFKI